MNLSRPMFPPQADRIVAPTRSALAPVENDNPASGGADIVPPEAAGELPRQHLLGGLAALSAAMDGVLAATPAMSDQSTYSRPDLAIRLENLYSRFKSQFEADQRENAAYDAARLSGADFVWSDPDLENWDPIRREGDALMLAILHQPAVTVADIVLQALICAFENRILWLDPSSVESMDPGTRAFRLLVDSICNFGGMPAFPGIMVLPVQSCSTTEAAL